MCGWKAELEPLEPVAPRTPLNDHLVVVSPYGVDGLARGRLSVRSARGGVRGPRTVFEAFRTVVLSHEEVEDRERSGFCRLGHDVPSQEHGVFVGVILDCCEQIAARTI